MKALILTLALVVYAAPAAAQEPVKAFNWSPLVLTAAGDAADLWSTQRFLTNGSGCVEGNSGMYGTRPSLTRLSVTSAVGVAAIGGLQYAIYRITRHGHSTLGRRVNLALGGYAAATSLQSAIRNVRGCPGGGL